MFLENGENFMNYQVPAYLTPFILTGMILVIATLVLGLRRALYQDRWPDPALPDLLPQAEGLLAVQSD